MKATVMGLGLFGGGAGAARFLVEHGAEVTITDLRPAEKLSKGLSLIEGLPVRLVLGTHQAEDFSGADLVVANPAVPLDSPFLKIAKEHGVPVETEITMMLERLPSKRVVGITGSNGKTTTSHLTYHMAKAAGERAWLGGNVGGSLLNDLAAIEPDDVVVLELSSFQLEWMSSQGLGPDVAVLTNLTPNHLDRHVTFDCYAAAKAGIFVRARGAVLNADDPESMARFKNLEIPMLRFSSKNRIEEGFSIDHGFIVDRVGDRESRLIAIDDVRLPGRFNLENIMAALAGIRLVLETGTIPESTLQAAAEFEGVPHRLEVVASKKGVRYINDSIATTPESCQAAIEAIEGNIHLIAGGYDKGLSLNSLADTLVKRVCTVFLLGETGENLHSAIMESAARKGLAAPLLFPVESLEEAVKQASREAIPGSAVLLSPGFASFDQFLNFEERGDCFRRCVAAL
ncbi:MAG: UDP-N-acetylmuramoyl-L-alanine--D-glutamate ligase [Planctomycetota bacterium]|jgi:UDP-N-acetylmuramoylalanine--D-glutamate ligase